MKRIISFGLFVFFLLGLVTAPAFCQTGDEIVEKMIEALGGRKVLEGFKDMTLNASVELISMGLNATITNYLKEPNLSRTDISVMGMVITQAFDGNTAWMINPQTGAVEDMPEEAQVYARRDNLGNTALLNPKKFGITFSYKGKEKIEDKEYLVLQQAFNDGFISTMYLDPVTYLSFKVMSKSLNNMMMEVDQESFPSEYKKVQGIMVPHSVTVFQDGEKFMTSTVTAVKINTGLEDSLFKK
jgi:outer membrane lipoprotein-sorting protein